MKWFYITGASLVVVLAVSPFILLDKQDIERPGIISYGTYGALVKSIDPATAGDTTSASIQGYFYESLFDYHFLKRPVELEPQLAAAMPDVSEDKLTYTIKIRPGVKYFRNPCFGWDEDGRPATREVKAQDFELGFKRIADFHINTQLSLALVQDKIAGLQAYRERTRGYHRGDFRRYDEPMEGVKALDEYTLEIKLTKPFPQLLYVLAMNNYAPVPRELIDYHLATEPDGRGGRKPMPLNQRTPEIHNPEEVVGTGAYMLDQWVAGSKIVLVRNPDYREIFYPCEGTEEDREAGLLADCGKQAPFIDVYHLRFIKEANPMWMLFLKQQTDTSGVPREMYSSVITPRKDLTDEYEKLGIKLHKYTTPAVYWFAFNMEDPVLGNSKSLRQALSLAYNVEEHIEDLYNGRGVRAVTYVPRDFESFTEAGPSPYARFDLDAARAKLADARKELEAAGVIAPGEDIPALTLDLGGTDDSSRKMGEFAQRQFRQIGIELKIEPNDWPTLQKKVHNKQTQMYSMGWHADYPDPENFLQLYYGPNIDLGTNNTNYQDDEFDRLYKEASIMGPSPQRTELYVQMLRILNEDCPVLLLSEPISYFLYWPWVQNVKPHPIGYGYAKFRRTDDKLRRQMIQQEGR
jgi:ABC-type transport system substrate-binding protein